MFSSLHKGFLGPFPLACQKFSQEEKGKTKHVFQGKTEVRAPWEDHIEMACLDPMDIELLKSSFDKPSWFDSKDCRITFETVRDNFDNIPDCQSYGFITQRLDDFNHQFRFPAINHEVVEASSSFPSFTDTELKVTHELKFVNPDQSGRISYSRKEMLALQHQYGQPLQPLVNLDFLGLASRSFKEKKSNHPKRRRRPRPNPRELIYHRDFLLFDRSKASSLKLGQKLEIYHPYSCSVITLRLQPRTPNAPNPLLNQPSKVLLTSEKASNIIQEVMYESSSCPIFVVEDPHISTVANGEILVEFSSKGMCSQDDTMCTSAMEDTCANMMEDEETSTNEVDDGQSQQVDGTRVYGLIGLGFSKSGLAHALHWAAKKERNISGNSSSRRTEPCHRKRLRVATYGLWVGRYPIKRRCVFSTYLSFPSCRNSAVPIEDALSWVE